ncbi:hypothetical protein T459_15894 [Capsicum annuum]|uniref:Uncharacterized protein n=1 Tax=Capsicum annuum TaxID=4072 RepID=A0A2G2Z770_CAPAN|nr:hypothetical protein T459_15894 [Capsicum annuum]
MKARGVGLEESWELLEKREFGEEICLDELLDVGKEIVQNCKGLPLVVDLIAGVIAGLEKTKSVWIEVRNNLNPFSLNSEVDVMKDDPDGVQDECAVCFSRLLSTHVHHSLTSLVLSADLDMMIRQSYKLQWLSVRGYVDEIGLEDIATDCKDLETLGHLLMRKNRMFP